MVRRDIKTLAPLPESAILDDFEGGRIPGKWHADFLPKGKFGPELIFTKVKSLQARDLRGRIYFVWTWMDFLLWLNDICYVTSWLLMLKLVSPVSPFQLIYKDIIKSYILNVW